MSKIENRTGIELLTKPKDILQQYAMTDTLNGEKLPEITRNMVHKMCKQDKKSYKKLPQKLTIYRGCHKDEVDNPKCQSWTLSLETARHFAWMHYAADGKFSYDEMKDRVVLKATIAKKDIFAYLELIREEKECIVNLSGLKNVEVIEEYDYDKLEDIYYGHLIKSLLRQHQLGIRGIIQILDFDEHIVSMDIEDFLFPTKEAIAELSKSD